MNSSKRVAIIGAGPAGLTAIKCCKEEGFVPVCYERNGEPGGLWRFHEEDIEGVASVMKTTVINTSKEISAFSDFPPPKEFPNFMHHSMMYRYFMLYAEHFDLLKHINYHLEVIKVEPSKDYEDTGRWTVSVRSSQTEAVTKSEFDAVIVCIGHHVYPKIPTFPGQKAFHGIITHTHSIKSCEQFSGKRVVVVGIGNSGVDAAVDCTFSGKMVYLSTRRGSWIFSRVGNCGRPYDMDFASRKKFFLSSFKSFDAICDDIEKEVNKRFDHEAYNLKPKHRILSAHPTLNDNLPNCILSGRIVIKGDIKKIVENGVVFEGEDHVTEVDVIILATGYLIKFPFLEDIVSIKENNVNLYKYIIPPSLSHKTLAIVGLVQPLGPIFPVAEMQCRWFIQSLCGHLKLPSTEYMEKDIKAKNDANAKRYIDSTRHTIQIDWIPYMDEIAQQIGAKPNMWKLALTDLKLFKACFGGPCLSYQYRLQGPHLWLGARKAILDLENRVYTPLNSKGKVISKENETYFNKGLFVLLLIGTATFFYANQRLINYKDILKF